MLGRSYWWSRIKPHLSKIEGHDIILCPNMPHDIATMFINEVASRRKSLQLENMFNVVSIESHEALAMQPKSS